MTEPWSSGFPKRKRGQAPPNSDIQATSKANYVEQSHGLSKCKPLLHTEWLNGRTVIRERWIKIRADSRKGIDT